MPEDKPEDGFWQVCRRLLGTIRIDFLHPAIDFTMLYTKKNL